MIKKEHISVTSEPDGLYRFHYTPAEAITPSTPSREIALVLYEWMVEHNKDKSIIVLGGDSTNSMSGYKGGAIAWVEKMLHRKVFCVICQIIDNFKIVNYYSYHHAF